MPSLKQMMPRWVRKPARKVLWDYRRATWRSRSFPDFIIIGAQKCGTSSLFAYLAQHPQLSPSYTKEVHFFDGGLNPGKDTFQAGAAWYRAHFPSGTSAKMHAFEASPLYMFHPLTPKRIVDLLPEVKLIAVLRNPTERAISQYFDASRKGRESLPMMQALREEETRLAPVMESEDYKSSTFRYHSYKSRGLYRRQIERFLEYFPRRQILILCSEELFREPEDSLRRVFEFVGVDAGFKVEDLTSRNVASNRSKVDPEVYAYLNDFFLPHNQALYELVGKDYGW